MAWLSVLVRSGNTTIKPRTVVKLCWEDTFGVLLDKLDLPEVMVEKVEICGNENFTEPVHVVPVCAPATLSQQFKCSNVRITIEPQQQQMEQQSSGQRNAADILMASSRQVVLPPALIPPEGKELRKDQKLYNDLLGKSL